MGRCIACLDGELSWLAFISLLRGWFARCGGWRVIVRLCYGGVLDKGDLKVEVEQGKEWVCH
jgi:hypothetical protein